MDQILPSDDASGQSTHRKWGRICPVELWGCYSPSGPITFPAFFQVLFPRILLYTPVTGTEQTWGGVSGKWRACFLFFSPPLFWSVFIGTKNEEKYLFSLLLTGNSTAALSLFRLWELFHRKWCDERDHWALWNLVHSCCNIRAGFLDNPALESFIHRLVSAKGPFALKTETLHFCEALNHYANVYLHQRKTVKRDTADRKMDQTFLITKLWYLLIYLKM